jgi:HlyD family secretion protein
MINLNWGSDGNKPWQWPGWVGMLGLGGVLLVGGGLAHRHWPGQPATTTVAMAAPAITQISALGRLEPDGEVVQIFAPTSMEGARVERLAVRLGQQVRSGDLIAVLDTYARRQAALREAQSQVQVAQAQLVQVQAGAKAGQIRAQAQVLARQRVELATETQAQVAAIARFAAELKNAELENQRYQALYREGAVTASMRDSKQLTVDTARQQLQQAKAELSRIQQSRQQQIAEAQATLAQIAEVRPVDINVARARLAQAQAGLARAQAELDLATVRAPQAGQVLKIHTRPGELVGNQGIISLGQTQRMVAVAEIYELDISRIRVGQRATVVSKNNAFAEVLQGRVVEVGLEVSKQDVLNTDPAAQFDARVVEVKVLLDPVSSRRVMGLTNLSIQVSIDVQP